MRIAIDARLIGGTSTGDSTYWTCLSQALLNLNSGLDLLFLSNQPKPENVPFIPDSQWKVIPAKSSRWWSLVAFPLAARRLGAQIAHAQYGISPLLKNAVSTVHDVSFMIEPSWFAARDRTLLETGVGITSRFAKRIVTVSETSADEIRKYFPKAAKKVRVGHNACPPWIQPLDEATASVLRRRVKVDGKYCLTVGTNWARKNMQLAVQAVEAVASETGLKLVVTGKAGSELNSPHVVSTGYVDTETLSSLYQAATLYLAPSLHEGFGIPLLEAMRCGAPVICGPGGAMPEVAGNAALIMSDYDVGTWAKGIGKLSSDPSKLQELVQRGHGRESQFTWERSAQEHLQVYREMI